MLWQKIKHIKTLVILASTACFCIYCYADIICCINATSSKTFNAKPAAKPAKIAAKSSFVSWLENEAYAEPAPRRINPNDKKEQIRKQWQDFLGFDVFYPVIKAREIVEERTKTNILDFHGSAQLNQGKVKYIFKKKF